MPRIFRDLIPKLKSTVYQKMLKSRATKFLLLAALNIFRTITAFFSLIDKNVFQFTYIEVKAPDSSEVLRSLQNYGALV